MDVKKKWRSAYFIGHERHKVFWGIFIVMMGVSPSNFVVVTFFLTSIQKGYFLRWLLRCYRCLMAESAVLVVFDIRLQASSRISIRNRLYEQNDTAFKLHKWKLSFPLPLTWFVWNFHWYRLWSLSVLHEAGFDPHLLLCVRDFHSTKQ